MKLIKRFRVKRPRLADLQDSGNPGLPSASAVQVADVFEQTAGLFSATKKIELKLPSSVMSVPESKHASEQVHLSHHISESSHLSQPSTVSADENYAQKAPTGHHKQQQQPVSAAEIQLTAQQNTSHQPTPVPPLDQQQLPLSSSHLTDSENKAYEFEPSLRTSHGMLFLLCCCLLTVSLLFVNCQLTVCYRHIYSLMKWLYTSSSQTSKS